MTNDIASHPLLDVVRPSAVAGEALSSEKREGETERETPSWIELWAPL